MKILAGIIIGIVLILSITKVYASGNSWNVLTTDIEKFTDGNVNCYVSKGAWSNVSAISCVKVK